MADHGTKNTGFRKNGAGAPRPTLASKTASRLSEYIHAENFRPGDRIPSEYELAAMFGVGRGTVREAVKQLIALNMLTIVPAKGTFVSGNINMPEDQLGLGLVEDKKKAALDLLELRITLECFAAGNAALNADEGQVQKLLEICGKLDRCEDYSKCLLIDIDFHKALAECSGNSVLPILSPILHSCYFLFGDVEFVRDWEEVSEQHRAIVSAIAQGDARLAEAETVKHLSTARKYIMT